MLMKQELHLCNTDTLKMSARGQERSGLSNIGSVVACMNATVTRSNINRVPEKNVKEELMDGAPAGSIAAYHPSGWMQTDIFTK